jgi:hypothetical protein
MTNTNHNGHAASPTRMDDIVETVTTQSRNVGHIISDLYDESSHRQLVIRNLDDAVILEVPLNGVIIGSLVLTAMMRLRWVIVLALLTLFGRFYITIEQIDETADANQADEESAEALAVPTKRPRRRVASTKSKRLES